MKKRRWLMIFILIVLLLMAASRLWLRAQQRQYALNRQLIAALSDFDAEKAEKWVDAGADPNTQYQSPPKPTLTDWWNMLFHRRTPSKEYNPTALQIACNIWWSNGRQIYNWGSDHPRLVESMLRHGGQVNATDDKKRSLLVYAVSPPQRKTVNVLLQYGADVNSRDVHGMTPLLHTMTYNDDPNIVRLLIDHGADISARQDTGRTALMWACEGDLSDCVRLLIVRGAQVNTQDQNGRTPLYYAVCDPDMLAVTMCLLASAFLLSLQQEWGEKMPTMTRPQVYYVVKALLPKPRLTPDDLLQWLQDTQQRNERAKRSHSKRRQARLLEGSLPNPSL